MSEKRDAIVNAEKEVRSYFWLNHGANVILAHGLRFEKEREGLGMFAPMSSLVLRAFAMEAYLNHLGRAVEGWDQKPLRSWSAKLNYLCRANGINRDDKKEPFATVKALFEFRNSLAHGKTVDLRLVDEAASWSMRPHDMMPRAEWDKACTLEFASKAKTQVESLIAMLHEASGAPGIPLADAPGIASIRWIDRDIRE